MEEALIRLPRLSAKVAALHQQHAHIIAELDSVIALLGATRSVRSIGIAFEHFAKRLGAHEAGENCVMAEAFGTDFADEANNV